MRYFIPALVAPFDQGGMIAEQALRSLIRWNLKKGVNGFYVNGSTGEFLNLKIEERERLLEIVKEESPANCIVINQIGSPRFQEIMQLAEHSRRIGVDMISVIPPLYFHYNEEEIQSYFLQIAHAAQLPLLVYNVPSLANTSISINVFSRLLEDPLIQGVKFTSYDLYSLTLLRNQHPDKTILIGHDELFLPALTLTVNGIIGSTLNFMAERFISINRLFSENKMDEAFSVQGAVNDIVKVLLETGIFPSIKYILAQIGLDCGVCRKPFMELGESAKRTLDEKVLKYL